MPIIFTNNEWKSLANPFRNDSKIVIQGKKMNYVTSNTPFYVLNTQLRKNQLSIADFAIVTRDGIFWLSIVTSLQLICDVTRTWGTGIVASYSSIVLARANWGKGDPHLCTTTVNIDFAPPSIHGLACKKNLSLHRLICLLKRDPVSYKETCWLWFPSAHWGWAIWLALSICRAT